MNFPEDLRYSKEHEWAKVSENQITIGITDHAQNELGDIVFLEITKKEGDMLEKNEIFGTVESVKTLSDIYAPIKGKIVKINSPLCDEPELINDEPYGKGWMITLEVENTDVLSELMSASEYKAYIESEAEGH